MQVYQKGTQYYITINFQEEQHNVHSIVLEFIKKHKLAIIYIKAFIENTPINNKDCDLALEIYKQEFNNPLIIKIEQISLGNNRICGICLFCIEKEFLSGIKHFQTKECQYISYQYKNLYYLWGTQVFKNASLMFEQCIYALNELQFAPKDIIRTWFYLDNINENYANFNIARKDFFEQNRIDYDEGANDLPPSTGIGCNSLFGNSVMQLSALKGDMGAFKKKRIYNAKQSEANGDKYLFRPTFSRAMLIESLDLSELHISGTASVGKKGETLFQNDGIGQIETTLHYIKHLLENANMTPIDICEGTVFMKDKYLYKHFIDICQKMNFPHEVLIPVIADICRQNLLFEIDGIAKK